MELKIYSLLILLGVCSVALSQKRSIPNTISSCYQNSTAYNRYTRQPMQIENLIAIVRKIETKLNNVWTPRQLSRTILKNFQFDGLSHDPDKKQEFRFETSPAEDHRTEIVHSLLPGEETIPDGTLDNDEKCALHWMLSHSLNATLRDDEESQNPTPQYRGYLRARRGSRRRRSNLNDSDDSSDYEEIEKDQDNSKSLKDTSNVASPSKSSNSSVAQLSTKQTSEESRGSGGLIPNLPVDVELQRDTEHYDPAALKFERATSLPASKKPVETGVIYTKWGAISGAQLLGGIAAGLEPLEQPVIITSESAFSGLPPANSGSGSSGNWNSGGFLGGQWSNRNREPTYPRSGNSGVLNAGRKKRQSGGSNYLQPILNYYAATLAGDIGQGALMNGVYSGPSSVSPPSGTFNDTICPREYTLNALANADHDAHHDHDTWSHMTAAELRGGLDGLLLGQQIQVWDRQYNYPLSEILSMYYSEKGIVGQPRYRACNRGSLFSGTVDSNQLWEQSKSFAYVYNNKTSLLKVATAANIEELYRVVRDAFDKATGFLSSLSSMDPPCMLRESSATELPDAEKAVSAPTTLYVVVDPTDTTDVDLIQQKRFAGQLAYDLGVNPWGSRIGLVNGADGTIRIKPNFTDNPAILACRILGENIRTQATQDPSRVLTNIQVELDRIREEELRYNYQDKNGVTILFLNQGKKWEANLRDDVRGKLYEFEQRHGDVHVMYATSKYQVADYDNFVLNRDYDVIKIQSSANLSTETGTFAKEFMKRNHGRLTYTHCNKDRYPQDGEAKMGTDLFISPNTLHYYKVSSDYFYSAKNLRLRFSSLNGKVRICASRDRRYPLNNSNDGSIVCRETKGTYVEPGSGTDAEIGYDKPCGKHGERAGCKPIYLSITPISGGTSEADRLDCSVDKCQYSDQVKVTFSHWDMRCNTAVHTLVSLPGLFIALFMSVVTFCKYS